MKQGQGRDASLQGEGSASGGEVATTDELARQLSELARVLEAEDDTEAVMDELVRAAVAQIPGVAEGSVSIVTRRRDVTSHSPSSELPRLVDALQAETGEGPCLDAVFEQQTVRVPDMSREQRWPRFARRAVEAGAASMLSFQLYVEGDNLGALNLYARQPNAFTEESEHVGLLLVAHGAVALAGAQKRDNLALALDTRDLIGQAKGILMERHKVSSHRAFTLLMRVSQQTNRKLGDVAEQLTTTGTLSPAHHPNVQ